MIKRDKGCSYLSNVAALALAGFTAIAHAGLTLSEALSLAQKQSEEALLLEEKDKRLQFQKQELWAGGLPNVSAYANAGRGAQPMNLQTFGQVFPSGGAGGPGPGGPAAANIQQDVFSYGLQVSQPIYSFGRLGQAFKVADMTINAQKQSKSRSLQEIQLKTLDAWYAVVTTRARFQVLDASLKRQRETVAFMQSNFTMGAGFRGQVLLAVANLKGLEPEQIRAKQAADASVMALNRILGRPVNEALDLDTTAHLASLDQVLVREETTIANAIENRADMKAMALQRDALEGTAKGYRMLHRPALGFQGKVGMMAYHLNQLAEWEQNKDWSIGLGLTWNVFDGLSTVSKANEFSSDARSVELGRQQMEKFARIQIETAFQERDAADSASSAAHQGVLAAREAVELLTQDFRAGKGTFTELLQAEEGLRNAEFGELAARFQLARSRAALRVALGLDLTTQESK
jgi:outer membrane protein